MDDHVRARLATAGVTGMDELHHAEALLAAGISLDQIEAWAVKYGPTLLAFAREVIDAVRGKSQ